MEEETWERGDVIEEEQRTRLKEKNTGGRKIRVDGSSLREEANWQKVYSMHA